MEISIEHPKYYDSFTKAIELNPNVVSSYYLTGDYDFMLKIICQSSDHVETIHREIKSLEGRIINKNSFYFKKY